MSTKHVHKYERVRLGENFVYRCVQLGCSHWLHPPMVTGRKSICWRCSKEFFIWKSKNGIPKRPYCKDCIRHREEKAA